MKVQILQEDLNKGLTTVGRVISGKGQLPVLGNVLIEAKKSGLVLSATNLEIGLRMEVGGKVIEEGAVTVPARNFGEFVGSLMGSLDLNNEGEKLTIKSGSSRAVFVGIAASEFPAFAEATTRQAVKIGRKIVEQVAKEVSYAAAVDESRPVLTGVKFAVSGSELIVVATDGFRMSRKIISKIQDLRFNGLILPARTIQELARLEGDAEMTVLEESNQVVFEMGKIELVSRVLEGNFPDVDKIIPTGSKTKVTVDREELLKVVRAAAIFARENSNIVKFMVHSSSLIVSAKAGSVGENESEIEAEVEGEENEIAFNFKYVLDFLGSVEAERVVMEMNDNLAPGVWKAEGDESLVHLIMPVRV